MIFEIFSPKNSAKKLVGFFTQNKAKLFKILSITLGFEKNANFFAENCRKSQKIVIITSTPGWPDWTNFRPIDGFFTFFSYLKITEVAKNFWATFFHG
jgi:hypothetical protein